MRPLFTLFAILGTFSLGVAPAGAQEVEPPNVAEARLSSLSRAQRELLAPHLERGPVLLARFYERQSDMPAISLAAYVEAAPIDVARVVQRPQEYPRFMPALDSISVESERGDQVAYSWTWQLALFTLQGRNVMTSYGGNATRGYRIDVRSTHGDLGRARYLWRIHPAGPGRSLVVLSARTDMRGANFVADQLASGGNSVQRSINIAMSMVMLLGTKQESERLVGYEAPITPLGSLTRPDVDPQRLWPLLEKGDLVFLELSGARVARVTGIGRSSRDLETTRAVMLDPEEFGRSLVSGSRAQVLETTDAGVLFEWGIPLPLVGVEGRMRLRPSEGVIEVDGESGSLHSSRWRFDTVAINPADTVVVGWSRYEMNETSPLIRTMIGGDASFSHGFAIATQVMVLRSLRSRSMRHRNP